MATKEKGPFEEGQVLITPTGEELSVDKVDSNGWPKVLDGEPVLDNEHVEWLLNNGAVIEYQ